MKQLLDDLLDYSRASLNLGIPVTPASMDLATTCREEIDLQRGAWPDNPIELATDGEMRGVWDAARLKQVLGNLIANAAALSSALRKTVFTVTLPRNSAAAAA